QPGAARVVRPGLYNLANSLRDLALPRPVQTWTLTTPREKLIKIGAKDVRHAKVVTFQLAEVAVPRVLFAAILWRIGRRRAGCGRRRARDDVRRASGRGVESRRMGSVCREVRGRAKGQAEGGRRGSRTVIRLADRSGQAAFPLTRGAAHVQL